ncbi:hypothetical protein C8Q76DRAFT_767470 [Earliella scabrosa]|nr:hypothetical protein C8Q76DRAFT_767470 [Earliella scabrosa]
MERRRWLHRVSYIWGRSVHNTRIERLWYDVTRGFGGKWKNFFMELEHSYSLDHIWLIHHLFLDVINADAQLEWAAAWLNAHRLEAPGSRRASREPSRALHVRNDTSRPARANYGVDWEVLEDETLMQHHFEHNPLPAPSHPLRPFSSTKPLELSTVPSSQVARLNSHLAFRVDRNDGDMHTRRLIWETSLVFFVYSGMHFPRAAYGLS